MKPRGELATRLAGGARQPAAASVWAELGDALARDDPSAWAAAHQRTRELWRVRPEAERLSQLLARVRAVAPRWAASLLEQAGRTGRHPSPANLRGAWLWSQLAHWLEAYLTARTPEALRREIDQLRHAEAMLIERHVAAATWANLQVRPEERQALVGWQQTISKIGKGTGKRAPELRRQAQERMNAARRAVPVWIMPLARVIENFSPSGPPFDVVIVDESSQSDTFGLLALLRAERAIIVGDDNQISPAAVGQKLAIVDQLIVQHLDGIPNRHLYDGQQSLYDLATAAFGGVIRLREHFRCVPDIISFSNALSYNGEIQPLRDAASTELLPPVILHRVPGFRAAGTDTNEVEAEEIAALVAACCEHPAYKDATLGAISLLGEAQAHAVYERVRQLVPIEELDRRQFVAGDAYHFQGDERDVMFLSLVEAPGTQTPAVLNRRPDQQRFNVAASRARDQIWIVHSIDAVAFHPEDMRGRLLTHFAAGDRRDRNWRKVDEILQDRRALLLPAPGGAADHRPRLSPPRRGPRRPIPHRSRGRRRRRQPRRRVRRRALSHPRHPPRRRGPADTAGAHRVEVLPGPGRGVLPGPRACTRAPLAPARGSRHPASHGGSSHRTRRSRLGAARGRRPASGAPEDQRHDAGGLR